MKKLSSQSQGIIYALLTAILSGVAIFYGKLAVVKVDPLVLTSSRNLYVAVAFFMLVSSSNKWKSFSRLSLKQWLGLIVVGCFGGGLAFYLFFSGLKLTTAASGNLIHKSLFLWIALGGALFLKEKNSWGNWLVFILVAVANFLWMPDTFAWGKGEYLVLAATLIWSAENLIAKKLLEELPSDMIALARMGLGALLLVSVIIASGRFGLFVSFLTTNSRMVFIGGTILFGYVYCWYRALKLLPAGLASALLSFAVVVGNLLSFAFLGQKPAFADIRSSVLILLALVLFLAHRYWQLRAVTAAKNE